MSEAEAAPVEGPEPVSVVPLTEPREGIPPVTHTDRQLRQVAERLSAGSGPVAIDAERASGYRYGQRAYLVQLRRSGSGSALVDPIPIDDFTPLAAVLAEPEWVLHAASQDLPCLDELGLRPQRVFDTELAARLLGRPRVGLGPLVEDVLGLGLEKGHAAVDWSTRPLPEPWLRYAVLDVEVLLELRDELAAELETTGKAGWAEQEFAAIVAAGPPAPRVDPWRRTSGLHKVRSRRSLAVVRELWQTRDAVARERDIAPGRILPDAAIVAAATSLPNSRNSLSELSEFSGRGTQRRIAVWWAAIETALKLPESQLPPQALPSDAPPPPRAWPERSPEAAARLGRARASLAAIAEANSLPVENLVSPDLVRRLMWEPPAPAGPDDVSLRMAELGARPWQVELTLTALVAAITG